jgi:ABC-type multidrug transport system ATPase subunit
VNGVAVLRKEVQKGDRMQIGPFLFVFDGKRFTRQFELTQISLVALELTKGSGRDKYLSDVSLAVNPGEFVGVLGPSGAGKSTLLNALNGLRPATSGNVLINGLDLYENFDQWRSAIGFVPQDDIVHRELTAEEAITYAARLRLPADSSTDDIRAVVDDAIKTVRLEHRRKASIATLSGGERKRVSVAVELVGSPGLLFLDEPTAALDPGTAGALMRTFRAMADQGRTLICTTHIMENLDLFDKITVLVRGRLAFFGLPVECMKHFGISRFADLYEKLESRPPEYWENLFRNSKSHATYVAEPIEPYRHTLIGNARPRGDARPRAGRWDQFFTLTSRYLRVFFADRRNAAWLLAQPLIVALLVNWVCTSFPLAAFLTSISCLWFGCNQSAREIVRERAIFARERMVGQSVGSYFASKAVVLTGVAVLQTILMVAFLYALTGCSGALAPQFAVFLVSGLFGTLLGLFVSTLVRSEMAAVTIVPLALIPQIILAGALVPVPYMNGMARALSCLCPTRWTNHAMDCSILHERTVSDALMKSEFVSIQNVFSQYDLRKAADLSSFLTEYGGKELDLVVSGTIALMVIALFCVLAVAVSLFVLHTRRPET